MITMEEVDQINNGEQNDDGFHWSEISNIESIGLLKRENDRNPKASAQI